jgi:hypothetical protein
MVERQYGHFSLRRSSPLANSAKAQTISKGLHYFGIPPNTQMVSASGRRRTSDTPRDQQERRRNMQFQFGAAAVFS